MYIYMYIHQTHTCKLAPANLIQDLFVPTYLTSKNTETFAHTRTHTNAQMGKGGETGEVTKMKASELMDTTAGFYTYPGSLTTPTCNAVVTWVVLASVLPIKGVCVRAARLHLIFMRSRECVMHLLWAIFLSSLRGDKCA